MSLYLIYALTDPRTQEVRYIGKSSYGMKRPRSHKLASVLRRDRTYKGNWIRALQAVGLSYEVRVLQELESSDQLDDAEVAWIQRARGLGWLLTNLTDGGDGQCGARFTPEHRAKMSAARKGMKFSPEHRARISAANKGRVLTEEQRQKISVARTGKKLSPEQCIRHGVARMKRIVCVSTGETFPSLKAACAATGIHVNGLLNVLKGRQKKTKGLIFAYSQEQNS